MLEKLAQKLENLANKRKGFDPLDLNDPIATRIDWTFTKAYNGIGNIHTHRLVKLNSNHMEFRVTIDGILICLFFLFMGIVITCISLFNINSFEAFMVIVGLFTGLGCTIIGSLMFYYFTMPIIFDKQKKIFWKGRKTPDNSIRSKTLGMFTEFENIHALQLVSNDNACYQLNLVLKNCMRISIVSHGNKMKLREDTKNLSSFLEKPVWDAL